MSACVRKFVVVRAAAHVMFQIRTEENDSRSDSGKNFKSPPLLFSPSLASNCKASIFFSLLPGKLFRPVTPNHGGADGERGGGRKGGLLSVIIPALFMPNFSTARYSPQMDKNSGAERKSQTFEDDFRYC